MTPADRAFREARAQGLSERVEDAAALARVAALIRTAPTSAPEGDAA